MTIIAGKKNDMIELATTRLRKNAQLNCAHIFWLSVTKILSVRTRVLIIVDYYTPCGYDSWLLLLFCYVDLLTMAPTRHFLLVYLKFEHPLIKTGVFNPRPAGRLQPTLS
jgi:hypothetical protein